MAQQERILEVRHSAIRSLYYKIQSPSGDIFEVVGGIYKWCKEHHIATWKYLKQTLTGERSDYNDWKLLEMRQK